MPRVALALGFVCTSCARAGGPASPWVARQPATGPLAIRVVYPPPQDTSLRVRDGSVIHADSLYAIQSHDSLFILGSVGRGDANLTVNNRDIAVYPTGGWLAWLPLPDDSIARFRLEATAGADTARATFLARVAPRFRPPRHPLWIDTTSFSPSGDWWVRPGEGVRLSVRATPGARLRAVFASGDTVVFLPEATVEPLPWGERAFGVTAPLDTLPAGPEAHSLWWTGRFGPDPGHVMSPAWPSLDDDPDWVQVEAILGADTTRARWPLRLAVIDQPVSPLVVVNDDTAGTGLTDRVLPGRPSPFGTYFWFFPNGTIARVSGRANSQVRLQLSKGSVAWTNVADIQPLRPGTPPPGGRITSLRLFPGEETVTLRIPAPARVPYRVDENDRAVVLRMYGVSADIDWIQYGGVNPFVRLVTFAQPAEDEVVITVELDRPVWGYRTRWAGHDLLLEIREPPAIDPSRPLEGRLIALDPGHPPAGARGPTGVYEADVTLAVARKARSLLEEAGANVVLLRSTDSSVGLIARTQAAERADADLLVSIHANALPDGVNPFVSNGTSVYYYHGRSALLAREVNSALVEQFGYRDLGFGRGDLHMARPTWMPAILTEGLFLIIPEQEAVLSSEAGQWRYARGIVEGTSRFLRDRAVRSP